MTFYAILEFKFRKTNISQSFSLNKEQYKLNPIFIKNLNIILNAKMTMFALLYLISSNIINSVPKVLSPQADYNPVKIFQNNGYF